MVRGLPDSGKPVDDDYPEVLEPSTKLQDASRPRQEACDRLHNRVPTKALS